MPHNPLENPTPLSNGRGKQQLTQQLQRHSITSRSPPIHSNYPIHKNRNNSALDIGSILNPVAATKTTATATIIPPENTIQRDSHINNNKDKHINDRYYQHSPPLQSSHGPVPSPPTKQIPIVYNGIPGSQPTRMQHEYTNRAMPPAFSTTSATTTPITTTMKHRNHSGGYTSDGSGDDNHTRKQFPHHKKSKEKAVANDSTVTRNIDADVPGTTTPTSEATLKWQPVETPQGHYQHYPGEPYNNTYNNNNNNSRLPLTNGYHSHSHHHQPPPPPSSAEMHSISPTAPMHVVPPPSTEFVNTMHHGHPYYPHQKHEPSAGPSLIQQTQTQPQPMYDTLPRQNSTSVYTGGAPTTSTVGEVSSPNRSGNFYYYYQYPTPESPKLNSSSAATSPFFNNENAGASDSRKRSLPLDYNQQSKRTRENSDFVTTPPYTMQPSSSASSSSSRAIDQQQQLPTSEPYTFYSFPSAPHPHHHQQQQPHPMYYHHPPPPHPHQQQHHAQSPYPPSSMDPNSIQHYQQQQHYPHPLPPFPPPTPPIKEKKKKKSKTTESGKPAKKGRPLKNPPSTTITATSTPTSTTAQQDAGLSLKPKELSSTLPDLSASSSISSSQPSTPTKPSLDEAVKKPKKRGRPPKTEAQKIADAAARAAAAKAAALANPSSPSSDNNTTKKKSTKKSGKLSSAILLKKEKEATRYCICQSILTIPKYMILCDHCQKWFHGACMGLTAKEGEFFDLYYCKDCTVKEGKKSTRRLPCANTTQCQNPARASTRGNSRSKYCSEECGMRVARMRLERAQRSYDIDHQYTITQEHPSLEKKLKGMLQAVQQQHQGKGQLNIDSNQWDLGRLARMKEERIKARAIVKFVDIQTQFLNQVVESQVDNDPKVCGYDSRLAWQNGVWNAIKHISREGTDVKVELTMEIEGVDVQEFTVCNKVGKCQKHEHWRELRQSELEVERRKQIDILTSLDRKRKQIKSRISDQLKQPEGWTFLDNGTICHD